MNSYSDNKTESPLNYWNKVISLWISSKVVASSRQI